MGTFFESKHRVNFRLIGMNLNSSYTGNIFLAILVQIFTKDEQMFLVNGEAKRDERQTKTTLYKYNFILFTLSKKEEPLPLLLLIHFFIDMYIYTSYTRDRS